MENKTDILGNTELHPGPGLVTYEFIIFDFSAKSPTIFLGKNYVKAYINNICFMCYNLNINKTVHHNKYLFLDILEKPDYEQILEDNEIIRIIR